MTKLKTNLSNKLNNITQKKTVRLAKRPSTQQTLTNLTTQPLTSKISSINRIKKKKSEKSCSNLTLISLLKEMLEFLSIWLPISSSDSTKSQFLRCKKTSFIELSFCSKKTNLSASNTSLTLWLKRNKSAYFLPKSGTSIKEVRSISLLSESLRTIMDILSLTLMKSSAEPLSSWNNLSQTQRLLSFTAFWTIISKRITQILSKFMMQL